MVWISGWSGVLGYREVWVRCGSVCAKVYHGVTVYNMECIGATLFQVVILIAFISRGFIV